MDAETDGVIGPRFIKASEFKANCLKLMDEVAESGEELVIARHGRAASRPGPHIRKPKLTFGRNRDNVGITGDIVSSMPAEWFDKPDGVDENLF